MLPKIGDIKYFIFVVWKNIHPFRPYLKMKECRPRSFSRNLSQTLPYTFWIRFYCISFIRKIQILTILEFNMREFPCPIIISKMIKPFSSAHHIVPKRWKFLNSDSASLRNFTRGQILCLRLHELPKSIGCAALKSRYCVLVVICRSVV